MPLCSIFFPWTGSTDIYNVQPQIKKARIKILRLLCHNLLTYPSHHNVVLGLEKLTLPTMFSWLWKSGTMTVWPFSFLIGTYFKQIHKLLYFSNGMLTQNASEKINHCNDKLNIIPWFNFPKLIGWLNDLSPFKTHIFFQWHWHHDR